MKALVERRHEKGAISNLGQSPTFMLAEDCANARMTGSGSTARLSIIKTCYPILQSLLQTLCFSAIEQNHKAVELRVGLADNAQRMAPDRLDQMHDIPSTCVRP